VSDQNVHLFRRMVDAVTARDPETQLAPLLAPDYHIDNIVTAVTDKTYNGVPGCLEWLQDMSEAFAPGARYEMEALVADTEEFVVTRMAFVGVGARSGAPLQLRWIAVTWCDRGKLTHSAGYANRREALEAVGLPG